MVLTVARCMQVLTPMRKGPAGVQSLNARLQALLNPPERGKGEIRVSSAAENPQILRVGDRVIQVCCSPAFTLWDGGAKRRMSVSHRQCSCDAQVGGLIILWCSCFLKHLAALDSSLGLIHSSRFIPCRLLTITTKRCSMVTLAMS